MRFAERGVPATWRKRSAIAVERLSLTRTRALYYPRRGCNGERSSFCVSTASADNPYAPYRHRTHALPTVTVPLPHTVPWLILFKLEFMTRGLLGVYSKSTPSLESHNSESTPS